MLAMSSLGRLVLDGMAEHVAELFERCFFRGHRERSIARRGHSAGQYKECPLWLVSIPLVREGIPSKPARSRGRGDQRRQDRPNYFGRSESLALHLAVLHH
jgi:hypothetical protein